MKKRPLLFSVGIAAIAGMLFAAFLIWADKNTFTYSNLADEESKAEAKAILRAHHVSQESIDLLFGLAEEYNGVPYDGLVQSGRKKAVIPFFSYDVKNGFAHLEAQERESMINCRSTAFLLLKESLRFAETEIVPDTAFDADNRYAFAEADLEHYALLFGGLDRTHAASSDDLAEKVLAYWEAAGIVFPEGGIHLLMAYADMQNGIQNMHTGVVVYADDCVWLLEKIDPIQPYQIARFKNREQLIAYMKRNVAEAEYAAIFSNDTCLWKK